MALSIPLPDDQQRRLQEVARRLNLSTEELAAAAVRDLLAQPAQDFEAAARRVLKKNHELYKRLA
jgi:predicted transcriptional regulator